MRFSSVISRQLDLPNLFFLSCLFLSSWYGFSYSFLSLFGLVASFSTSSSSKRIKKRRRRRPAGKYNEEIWKGKKMMGATKVLASSSSSNPNVKQQVLFGNEWIERAKREREKKEKRRHRGSVYISRVKKKKVNKKKKRKEVKMTVTKIERTREKETNEITRGILLTGGYTRIPCRLWSLDNVLDILWIYIYWRCRECQTENHARTLQANLLCCIDLDAAVLFLNIFFYISGGPVDTLFLSCRAATM